LRSDVAREGEKEADARRDLVAKDPDAEERLQDAANSCQGGEGEVSSGACSRTGMRTSDAPAEIMCEMGDVTLIERKPAMQMRKPKTPCRTRVVRRRGQVRSTTARRDGQSERRTVTRAPVMNVPNPSPASPVPMSMSNTTHTSPLRMTNGAMTMADSRFE